MEWETIGVRPISANDAPFSDDLTMLMAFWIILDRAARNPFTIKSNFARHAAWFVGVCACQNLISLEVDYEVFGDTWNITEEGKEFLEAIDERIKELM